MSKIEKIILKQLDISDKLLIDKIDTTNLKNCLTFNKKYRIDYYTDILLPFIFLNFQNLKNIKTKSIYCKECFILIFNYLFNIYKNVDQLETFVNNAKMFDTNFFVKLAIRDNLIQEGPNMIDDYFQKRKKYCRFCSD